jgi:hypothetical protein
MKMQVPIKHPDWLRNCTTDETLRLAAEEKLPKTIAGWMLVVALKRPLRAVYGSDLRAALALLWQATIRKWIDEVAYQWWAWRNPQEIKAFDEETVDELPTSIEHFPRGLPSPVLRDLPALDAVTAARYGFSNFRTQVGKSVEYIRDQNSFLRMCKKIEEHGATMAIASHTAVVTALKNLDNACRVADANESLGDVDGSLLDAAQAALKLAGEDQ